VGVDCEGVDVVLFSSFSCIGLDTHFQVVVLLFCWPALCKESGEATSGEPANTFERAGMESEKGDVPGPYGLLRSRFLQRICIAADESGKHVHLI